MVIKTEIFNNFSHFVPCSNYSVEYLEINMINFTRIEKNKVIFHKFRKSLTHFQIK